MRSLRSFVMFAAFAYSQVSLASFVENCRFEAEVKSVVAVGQLNQSVSYDERTLLMTINVLNVLSASGHTDCTRHIGGEPMIHVTNEQAEKYPAGTKLTLDYSEANGLSPSGVVGEVSWKIVDAFDGLFPGGGYITSATIDAENKKFVFDLIVGGGCGEHKYKLKLVEGCRESFPVQCKLDLIHMTNDLCEALIAEHVEITFDEAGLDDSYYDRAYLEIIDPSGNGFNLQLPQYPF